jgi:hypothetical protein
MRLSLTSDDRTSASLFPSDHVRKREDPPRGLARTPNRRRVLAVDLGDRAPRRGDGRRAHGAAGVGEDQARSRPRAGAECRMVRRGRVGADHCTSGHTRRNARRSNGCTPASPRPACGRMVDTTSSGRRATYGARTPEDDLASSGGSSTPGVGAPRCPSDLGLHLGSRRRALRRRLVSGRRGMPIAAPTMPPATRARMRITTTSADELLVCSHRSQKRLRGTPHPFDV